MTREELRDYVDEQRSLDNIPYHVYSTLIDGIDTLEQEPCEDAISRQAVEKITWEEPSYTDALNVLTEVRDKIRALPPVTPQPKTGHWIGIDEEPHEDWECDNCGFAIWADENIEKFHYCPNCGTKMIEPQESEDKKREPKYCDRNICVSNEYNGISCDECEVNAESEVQDADSN